MKKTLLTLAVAIMSYCSFAQTNQLNSTGSVGIGTLSPESGWILDVNGLGTIGTQGSARIYMGTIDATHAFIQSRDNSINQKLEFDASSYNFNIGNVGIGATSPGQKLEVAGNILLTGTNGLILNTAGGGAIDNQTGNLFFQKANGAGFIFRNTSPTYTEYMRIDASGNVGIGTINPDAKLSVQGTIHSNEVKVDTRVPVPDYVFEPNYKLTDLKELKTYVDKNHHLPEIPSAEQMAKEGLNLGDMNIKLLKKVEELTLYLLEKDKQMQEQQQVNQSLQEQINQLKEQLTTLTKTLTKN